MAAHTIKRHSRIRTKALQSIEDLTETGKRLGLRCETVGSLFGGGAIRWLVGTTSRERRAARRSAARK